MKKTTDECREADSTFPISLPAASTERSSTEILQGRREIIIVHQGARYRLQLTRNGKLILTK
ncbi:MAG TPA: hemin uptake protein HemP [Rhodocyclaceae bacterium]|nr:hemin uptake protein HemP [Rhodocyclaceae bacterium]